MSPDANTNLRIALLSPAAGTGNVGDHFIEMAIRRILGDEVACQRFSIRRPLSPADIEAINTTRCALLCGTNLYQREWESTLTPEELSRMSVPVIPFGVGSSAASLNDTEVGAQTRRMIQALHGRCAVGSVRDPHAAAVVTQAGVQNVIVTGCPVLFWAREGGLPSIRPLRRRRIVLTARNWLMHRWPDNIDHPAQIELMRKLLEHFRRDELLFAIHEDFDRRLVELLNIPREIVVESDDPAEYVRLYSDPDNVVFAMRLHAGMLALANGVPALFVGHDTRTYSFCQMMHIGCLDLFDKRCAAESIGQLERLLSGDVTPLAGIHTGFTMLRQAMRHFLAANELPVTADSGDEGGGV